MSVTNEQLAALLGDVAKRLTAIEDKLASGGAVAAAPPSSGGDDVSAVTAEFDAVVSKFGVTFRESSAALGADAEALVRRRDGGAHCACARPRACRWRSRP